MSEHLCHMDNGNQCAGLCTARISIFQPLAPQEQRALIQNARQHHLPAGQTIFREGDPAEQVLVLHRGRIKLCRYSLEGRETVLDILSAGNIYGEQRLFSGLNHEVDAVTLEPTSYCEILKKDIEALIYKHPAVGIKLLEAVGLKYSRACRLHEMLSLSDAKARLAGFLVHRAQELHSNTIRLARGNIAASINLRPETISRKLRELQQDGLLEVEGHQIIRLKDREALRRLYEGAE